VRNRIADATKEFEKQLRNCGRGHGADGGISTRRGDLSRFVAAFSTEDRGKAPSSLRDMLCSVNSIIGIDPDASHNARHDVVELRRMERSLARRSEAFAAHRYRVRRGSPAANVATVNRTRWHTSACASFVFMLKNLAPICDFFKTQSNPKAKAVVDALADLTSVTADPEGHANFPEAPRRFQARRRVRCVSWIPPFDARKRVRTGGLGWTRAVRRTGVVRPGGAFICDGDAWHSEARAAKALAAANRPGLAEAEFPPRRNGDVTGTLGGVPSVGRGVFSSIHKDGRRPANP
jgi:hypothetical protein